MRLPIAILTICMLFVLDAAETKKEVQPLFALFVTSVERVFELGDELWNKIGDSQAKDALADVSSSAATLEGVKDKLRQDLVNERILTNGELSTRIGELKRAVQTLARQLEKYAREIDNAAQSANGPGQDLRIQAQHVANSKMDELDALRRDWRPNDNASQQRCVQHLDEAIADLRELRCAVRCLQETINQKKKVCDPKKLLKPGGACSI